MRAWRVRALRRSSRDVLGVVGAAPCVVIIPPEFLSERYGTDRHLDDALIASDTSSQN
jgi:hypothetical protein